MNQLQGKTALVTGGTTGIGLAAAHRFVAEGAHVFVTGRRQAELDGAAAALGPAATAVRGDVADLEDLTRIFDLVADRGYGLGVLFANAGRGAFTPLEKLTPADFDQTFDINVRGTVFTEQTALPVLNQRVSIILTGSTSASKGTVAFGVYAASKAALSSFARTWAAELSERGIRVNTVIPGRPTRRDCEVRLRLRTRPRSCSTRWPPASRSAGSAPPMISRTPCSSWPPTSPASLPGASCSSTEARSTSEATGPDRADNRRRRS